MKINKKPPENLQLQNESNHKIGKLINEEYSNISNINEKGMEDSHQDTLFNDDNSLSLLIATKEEYFVCHICNHKCKQKNNLQIHMERHTAKKPMLMCQLCHLKFTSKAVLNFHMKIKHSDAVQEISLQSSLGNVSSDSKDNLQTRTCQNRMNTEEVSLKRNIGAWKVKQRPRLDAHKKIHNSKTFNCSLCQAQFTDRANLHFHMEENHITKDLSGLHKNSYKCEFCNLSNTQRGNLKIHMRTHSGEKPFKCKTCKKEFTQMCHLQVHNRRHTGEKPFACSFCSCKFLQKSNLVVHMKNHEN